MGRHLCIKVYIEDPDNEEVNITTLSSEDGNVKTVTINSRFIHSCLGEIQKNKSDGSPNSIICPVLIDETSLNLNLETEPILCNNNKTKTDLKEDRDETPKLNQDCEQGSFQDVQLIKNDEYQFQEKNSIGSKILDVPYSIGKETVSSNEIENNSQSNRKDKMISSPILSKEIEQIYNNNNDNNNNNNVSNESTVHSDMSTRNYTSNPIDSIKNVKYNVDDFLSEVNKQKPFEEKYGSSFMSDTLYDVETQIEYPNNDTESYDQIKEEYYVVDGVIGSRYNAKIKKEEFLLKLKRCIAKNEPWNLIVDPATCPNLPIFEYGRLFIATPDSVKHMEYFEGNVLCDKFLSENGVLQDKNSMYSVDLKKSEEAIPNFENEKTDPINENCDFDFDMEMCDTGTNFKDTVFPELAEELPEIVDEIINNTNIAHLQIRRKRINVNNVISATTELSSIDCCQVRRKNVHKSGSTFNASDRKKIELKKLKTILNKEITCGRTKFFDETCKSSEPLKEVALKSLQNTEEISNSNELIMKNGPYQPQKLPRKNVIESDIDGFSKKVNCKQLRTLVRKKNKIKSATFSELSQKFEKRNVQNKYNMIEICDTSYARKKSEKLPKVTETGLVNKSTTSVTTEPSKNVPKSVETFTLLKCSYCDYKTKRENIFQNHIRNHIAEKRTCELCRDVFRTNTMLRNHKRVHSFSKENLSKNQTTVGDMNRDFVNMSRKIQERNNNLHSSSMFIKKDKCSCATCGKMFYNMRLLMKHVNMHKDAKKNIGTMCFKCDESHNENARRKTSQFINNCEIVSDTPQNTCDNTLSVSNKECLSDFSKCPLVLSTHRTISELSRSQVQFSEKTELANMQVLKYTNAKGNKSEMKSTLVECSETEEKNFKVSSFLTGEEMHTIPEKELPKILKKSNLLTTMVVDSDHPGLTCDTKFSQKESAVKSTHKPSSGAELYEKANNKMESSGKLVTENENKGTKSSKKFITCSACKQLFQRGYGFIVHRKQHAENNLTVHSNKRSCTEGQFENKYPIVKLQRVV